MARNTNTMNIDINDDEDDTSHTKTHDITQPPHKQSPATQETTQTTVDEQRQDNERTNKKMTLRPRTNLKINTEIRRENEVEPISIRNPNTNTLNIGSSKDTNRTTSMFYTNIFVPSKETRHSARTKQLLAILQRIDSNFHILPFQDDKLPHISQPEMVPLDIEDLDHYITDIKRTETHLSFRFRGSYTLQKRQFNRTLIDNIRGTRNYVRQEKLNTEHTSEIGWLYGIHPNFCNRDKLNETLNRMLKTQYERWQNTESEEDIWKEDIKEKLKINIFPKRVWAMHKSNRIETKALSIECPRDIKQQIEKLITKVTMLDFFTEQYPHAMIIPYGQALRAFHIKLHDFIHMQNIINNTSKKFTLFHLRNLDHTENHDNKTLRQVIIQHLPKYEDGTSKILHITKGINEHDTVFTFDRHDADTIELYLENLDENLKEDFRDGIRSDNDSAKTRMKNFSNNTRKHM